MDINGILTLIEFVNILRTKLTKRWNQTFKLEKGSHLEYRGVKKEIIDSNYSSLVLEASSLDVSSFLGASLVLDTSGLDSFSVLDAFSNLEI